MIQIQELIKHFVLGIVSLFIINITMADDIKIKDFNEVIREVKEEYAKDSFEYSIPNALILTVATGETGRMKFKGAPTAQEANNFFGIHATQGDNFLTTQQGAKLAKYDSPADSVRAFINLITTGNAYEGVRKAIETEQPIENIFMNMGKYAEREDYPQFLTNIYKSTIRDMLNPILPKRKPIIDQMKRLQ